MKNKDRYDLTELDIKLSYMTNGCGKKIDNPVYITIQNKGNAVLEEATYDNPFRFLMKWLERESKEEIEEENISLF